MQKATNDQLISKITKQIDYIEDQFQKIFQENEEIEIENGEAIESLITRILFEKYVFSFHVRIFNDQYLLDDKRLEFYFEVYNFIKLEHFELDEKIT